MIDESPIASLGTFPLRGSWYRAVNLAFVSTAMATAHTKNIPSRFYGADLSDNRFETLYLAEDHHISLFEARHWYGDPRDATKFFPAFTSGSIGIRVNFQLQHVIDLSAVSTQNAIGSTCQELTGDWKGYLFRSSSAPVPEPIGIAPTQLLGSALFEDPEIEAAIYTSSVSADRRCLVIFPEKMNIGSYFEATDPISGSTKRKEGIR